MTLIYPDDSYEIFVFAAPEDDRTAWELSYDKAEECLVHIDPQAHIKRDRSRPGNHGRFRYQATFPFGWAEGNVSVDHDSVSLSNATVDKAAHFAAWLRHNLLPPGVGIDFNFFDGIEEGTPPGTLPDTDDVDVLRAVIERYVRGVLLGDS